MANTSLVYFLVSVLFNNSIVILLVLLGGSLKFYFEGIWIVKMVVNYKNVFCVISNLKIITFQVSVVC